MGYEAAKSRYDGKKYRRCGNSGLLLPPVSLGLWHNFGFVDDFENSRRVVRRAFDLGVTHFDLANNYGPPPGSAETSFGKIVKKDLRPYRDEIIVSTKAGYNMWQGPYGEWGSKKYLVASLDRSLLRMGLDYVDIFYSHRPDPQTPFEETVGALDLIVRQGKALYAGLSNYDPEQTRRALAIFRQLGTPCLIHQDSYSMFNRGPENGLLGLLDQEKIGCIVFSPLAQGLLSEKYLKGIPRDSRAAKGIFLKPEHVTDEKIAKVRKLAAMAKARNQSVSQLALAWVLRHDCVVSALIGARTVGQLEENVAVASRLDLSAEELKSIDTILS